jgi:sucrose phosphorylase
MNDQTRTDALHDRIRQKLTALYGDSAAEAAFRQLEPVLIPIASSRSSALPISERDVMLIAYGDHVRRPEEAPLRTLHRLLRQLNLPLTSVHILPFYPYSSDDGFSVIDYYAIDPALGTWEDVRRLSADYRLMFDAVFNHISAKSEWFQAFLRQEAPYTDYFVTLPEGTDVSMVTRPRTHPLLTPFETANGVKYVWTTFSDDQIDLNAANPAVVIELLKALRFYVEQGAQYIRLDAIAFLWKKVGTTSIHLPETHLIIQLMRDVLDVIAPDTILITETNVPHVENLSYFGDGTNEAQMVYNFALPPLIYHTMHTSDAAHLTQWAKTIRRVSDRTTFFNFTASHDGIGVRPVQDILSADEIAALVQRTRDHGGQVSMKNNSDGTQSPYELNITYFDAITAPSVTESQPEVAVKRFIVSQAIMLAMIGVPGIYFHSLFGSRNDLAGVQATGRARSINREKLNADTLLHELATRTSLRSAVFSNYVRLLEIRTTEPAFHPLGGQSVLELHPAVFALERTNPAGDRRVIALHNVSGDTVTVTLPDSGQRRDLISGQAVSGSAQLAPYQVMWLRG